MTPTYFECPISREFDVMDQLSITLIACLFVRKGLSIDAQNLCDTDALIDMLQSRDDIPVYHERNLIQALQKLRLEHKHPQFITHTSHILDAIIHHQDHSDLIDSCISQFTDYSRGAKMFFQSPQLTKLICSIPHIDDPCTVYNPFAGLGSFATGLDTCEYHADEYDPYTWALGVLRLEYYGISSAHYTLNDSIKHWNAAKKSYDLIITNPPVNIDSHDLSHVSLDELIINNSLQTLTPTGTLLFVCSSAYIHGKGFVSSDPAGQRKQLVDNRHLKAIYEIPTESSMYQYLNPAKPRYLLEIDMRAAHDSVHFYITPENYSNTGITLADYRHIAVSFQEITDNKYRLEGRRYLQRQTNRTRIETEKDTVALRDLLDVFTAPYPQASIDGPIFTSKHLASTAFNYTVQPHDLSTSTVDPKKMKQLNKPTLVCAHMYTRIKPTYVTATQNTPVYLRGSYITCQIKDKRIELDYLVFALNQADAIEQFKALSSHGVIASITASDFLEICIPVPKPKKQRELVAQGLQKEIGKLGGVIESMQKSYMHTLHLRKHAMGQEVLHIRTIIDRLFKVMDKQGQLSLDTLVGRSTGNTCADYRNNLQHHVQELSSMVDNMLSDNAYGDSIHISLIPYFQAWCNKHKADGNFDWELIEEYSNEIGPSILMPLEALDTIMQNITSNAEKYAFTQSERQDYRICILISETDDNTVCIRITNNGRPLDESIHKNNIFQDSVTTGKGSGKGAWQIKDIMDHFGQEVHIIDDKEAEFPFGYNLFFEKKTPKQEQ